MRQFNIKIFADGARIEDIKRLNKLEYVSGFTTNPSLMRKANIENCLQFYKDAIAEIGDKSISFEVFSDDLNEMKEQAFKLASLGENVYVKIPITNSKGVSCEFLIKELSHSRVKVNVTGVFTFDQIFGASKSLRAGENSIISVFAGRIADTGRDPAAHMAAAKSIISEIDPKIELLWASNRQVFDVILAESSGASIITCLPEILGKLHLIGKDLSEYSLETVTGFYEDAKKSNYIL